MAIPKVRNLPAIRSQNPLLYEALQDIIAGMSNISTQTNSHPNKPADPPSNINAINVIGSGGFHDIQIQDNTPAQRGLNYFAEWDTSPNFSNFKVIPMGPARNWRGQLGINGPIFVRAYSSYATSSPSTPVYFGTHTNPTPVNAGGVTLTVSGVTAGAATVSATGVISGPTPQASTGSGTEPSVQPQGGAGFGFNANRNNIPRLPNG